MKKWCIEQKIPAHLRNALPVIALGDRPAAVAGLGPDSAFLPKRGRTRGTFASPLRKISPMGKIACLDGGFVILFLIERTIQMLEKDIQQVLFTEEQLKARVSELGPAD